MPQTPATPPTPATDRAPTPRRTRAIALLIAALALVALAVSGFALAQRIRQFNTDADRTFYVFRAIPRTSFEFAGREVHITEDIDEDTGEGSVTIAYGDDALTLPVTVPMRHALPGLERHRDWLRIQAFAEFEPPADEFERRFESGEIEARIVIVTRTPMGVEQAREGMLEKRGIELEVPEDEWGWGEVRRDRWLFTFHELLAGGGFESEQLRFPESGNSFYRRQVRADQRGEPAPVRREDELKEYTWQYQAALPLMNRRPGITHEQQALRNSGWTLPVASASVIVFIFAIAWAFAPVRVRA